MNTFRQRRKRIGLTKVGIAEIFGVSRRTIYNWEASEAPTLAHLALDGLISEAKRRAEEKPGNI